MSPRTVDDYRPVWQTWSMVQPPQRGRTTTEAAPAAAAPVSQVDAHEAWRQRIQIARIERRWSIADLASRVQCDVATLAAVERGEEVLDADARQRLIAALGL